MNGRIVFTWFIMTGGELLFLGSTYLPLYRYVKKNFSLPHENIRKLQSFLMSSEGRERVHWEQMG